MDKLTDDVGVKVVASSVGGKVGVTKGGLLGEFVVFYRVEAKAKQGREY